MEPDVTLADLTELVAENLPEGWTFTLRMREGEIDMELIDPEGQSIERNHDDLTFNQMVLDLLNYARNSDGLQGVDLKGLSDGFIQEIE